VNKIGKAFLDQWSHRISNNPYKKRIRNNPVHRTTP